MIRRLNTYFSQFIGHALAPYILAVMAFVESIICPVIPDILLLPLVFKNPDKFLRYTLVCIVCSVLGGMVGYCIGYFLFDSMGKFIVNIYGQDTLTGSKSFLKRYGHLALAIGALIPIPYKLIAISSGIAKMPFTLFVGISVVSRCLRFFSITLLMRFFYPFFKRFASKRGVMWE